MRPSAPSWRRPGRPGQLARPPRLRDEQGSATVLVLAVAGLLMFVALALGAVAGLVVGQRRAQSAADLAALAGAAALADAGDPCGAAGGAAWLNGADLDGCTVDGRSVRLTVSLTGPDLPGPLGSPTITAEARAGPA